MESILVCVLCLSVHLFDFYEIFSVTCLCLFCESRLQIWEIIYCISSCLDYRPAIIMFIHYVIITITHYQLYAIAKWRPSGNLYFRSTAEHVAFRYNRSGKGTFLLSTFLLRRVFPSVWRVIDHRRSSCRASLRLKKKLQTKQQNVEKFEAKIIQSNLIQF